MSKKTKIIFIFICLLAAFLRFYKVTEFPAGVNADEAAYAYNAYSLLKTGRDEHGESWPVHLKSFADYKPAGTTYILLPFIKILGLSETALRIPSALFGVISVIILFFFVKEIFGKEILALMASFFLAISPWHIHFSRGCWETNLATTFMLLGLFLFLKGVKNSKFWFLSVASFGLSMWIYHSPRVIIPFLAAFLFYSYRQKIFENKKRIIQLLIFGLIIILPLILSFLGPAGSARFSGVSVFSDIGPFWQVNRQRGEHDNPSSSSVRLLHNKVVAYGLKFSQNYFDHFDGVYLFILGDRIKRSNAPDVGEMFLFDILFLPLGFYFLFRKQPKGWFLPVVWLLVAPLPASLTFQTPNALRAHNMIIPLVIISSYGFYNLIVWFREKLTKKLLLAFYFFLVVIFSWNVAYFLHQYFVHYPKAYAEAWEYGIKDLVAFLTPIKDNYEKIYVTEKYDQPYIIFAFYMQYPPEKLQKEIVLTQRDKFGFSTVRDFDKFHFENIDWNVLVSKSNILVCGTDEEIPERAKIIKEILFKNGKPAFQCAKI